jgi:hypothetical protein
VTTKKTPKKPVEKPEPKKDRKFRVLKGASFQGQPGKTRRIKPGQVVDDLPERVIESLLRQGAIEEVK